jgi:hypothetical protein
MKPSRVRLAVCALLFLGWIGWLVYLSATTTRPVVLSRPQFLAADLYVIAELREGRSSPEPRFRDELAALLFAAPSAGFPAAVPWGPVRLSTIPPKGDAHTEAARVNAPAPEVRIREVVWPTSLAGDLNGKELVIRNLPLSGPAQRWVGPGEYILALTALRSSGKNLYLVTPIPRSPGYYGPTSDPKTRLPPGRIYRATATARRELDDLKREFHGQGR